MHELRLLILIALLALCACSAKVSSVPLVRYDSGEVVLWKPCSVDRAEKLAQSGRYGDMLESAACSAWLLESGAVKSAEFAKKSNGVARKYLDKYPQSGVGHYLSAYLVAKEAQLAPMRGLDLVPVVEQEALRASKLSPEVDFGGPDRMLGELYLHAPSPPLSIGDLDNALEYYEKAVQVEPDFALNRLGFAATLMEDDDKEQACSQFRMAVKSESFDEILLKNDEFAKLAHECR